MQLNRSLKRDTPFTSTEYKGDPERNFGILLVETRILQTTILKEASIMKGETDGQTVDPEKITREYISAPIATNAVMDERKSSDQFMPLFIEFLS